MLILDKALFLDYYYYYYYYYFFFFFFFFFYSLGIHTCSLIQYFVLKCLPACCEARTTRAFGILSIGCSSELRWVACSHQGIERDVLMAAPGDRCLFKSLWGPDFCSDLFRVGWVGGWMRCIAGLQLGMWHWLYRLCIVHQPLVRRCAVFPRLLIVLLHF